MEYKVGDIVEVVSNDLDYLQGSRLRITSINNKRNTFTFIDIDDFTDGEYYLNDDFKLYKAKEETPYDYLDNIQRNIQNDL